MPNPHPTRERILQAAMQLIWRHGYQGTSPNMIMKASRTGQGSFYHHFRDKEDLGLAVIERLTSNHQQALAEIFEDTLSPMERIEGWLDFIDNGAREHCELGCPFGNLCLELSGSNEEMRERLRLAFDTIESFLTRALEEARRAGEISGDYNPQMMAEWMVGSVEGAYLLAKNRKNPETVSRMVGMIRHVISARGARPPAWGSPGELPLAHKQLD